MRTNFDSNSQITALDSQELAAVQGGFALLQRADPRIVERVRRFIEDLRDGKVDGPPPPRRIPRILPL